MRCVGFLLIVLAAPLTARARQQAMAEKTVSDVAKARRLPLGAPKASDVIMRSLRLHPVNDKDPHDTMKALEEFHVTRLEWAYISNQAFIERVRASGRLFGGAASAPSYHREPKEPGWFEKVVILNLNGEPIIAPWKRTWTRTLWGCVNNPELERGYLEYLSRYIDAGAQVMQRDEPGANLNATRWGGCFCSHCMTAFRAFLAAKTTAEQRQKLGVADVTTFDYREHLRKQGAPVGDAFGRWDGGELKALFGQFQTEATIALHQRTRKALDDYAGRRVPMSCNNGVRRWGAIERCFDWAFGELSYGHAIPTRIHRAMQEASRRSRVQVVTMPKKSDTKNPEEWQRRTRCTIAMAYACGGHCMVPWDTYMPGNAPRYFGTPGQYADLYGFIRAAARYLDGFEEAYAVGKGIRDDRYGDTPPIRLRAPSSVYAVVRARPGQPDETVVVHLVDWSAEPKPFAIELAPARFFRARKCESRLLLPVPYDAAMHQDAERRKSYERLVQDARLKPAVDGSIRIPPLRPWGLLLVVPSPAP